MEEPKDGIVNVILTGKKYNELLKEIEHLKDGYKKILIEGTCVGLFTTYGVHSYLALYPKERFDKFSLDKFKTILLTEEQLNKLI